MKEYGNGISVEPHPRQWVSMYDSKPYDDDDDDAPVLEFWEMWNTSSLPLLLVPLLIWVVARDKVPSLLQIELFKLFVLDSNSWNHFTVCKHMSFHSFKKM